MSQSKQSDYPSHYNSQSNSRSRSRSYDKQQKVVNNQYNQKKMIHIANLPTSINEDQLKNELQQHGKIEHMKLVKESPDGNPLQHSFYAFVTLESQEVAQIIVKSFQNHPQWRVNFKKSQQDKQRGYNQNSYEKPGYYNRNQMNNYQNQHSQNYYQNQNQNQGQYRGNNQNFNNNVNHFNNRNYSSDRPYQRRQNFNNNYGKQNDSYSSNRNSYNSAYNNNSQYQSRNSGYQNNYNQKQNQNFQDEQEGGNSQIQQENFANLLFMNSDELNKKLELNNNQNQIITEQILVRELFIGNISMEITEKQLLKTLEVYGKIEELELKNQNNVQYAFVKYYKIQDATNAFFNHQNIGLLLNQSLKIQFSDHQRRSNIVGDNEKEMKTDELSKILYINYHPNSHKVPTEEKVRAVCSTYGQVLKVNFNSFKNTPLKSFFLVEFDKVEDVKWAFKSLNNKKYKLQDETCEIAVLLNAEQITKGRDKSQFLPQKNPNFQNPNFNQGRGQYTSNYGGGNQNSFNNRNFNNNNYNNRIDNRNQQYANQKGNPNLSQQNQYNQNFKNNNYNNRNFNQSLNPRYGGNNAYQGNMPMQKNFQNNQQFTNTNSNMYQNQPQSYPNKINNHQNFENMDQLKGQQISDQKQNQNKDFIGAIDEIIGEIDQDNSQKQNGNDTIKEKDINQKNQIIKQTDLLEDHDAIWSGFIAKPEIPKVGVDLKILNQEKEVHINDYHMQIIKMVPIEQAFQKQTILIALLIPSNGLYLEGFKVLAKQLEEQQQSGFIKAENYNIYVIPKSKESELTCDLADDQSEMLAFVQEIKAQPAKKQLKQLLNKQDDVTQKSSSYQIQQDQEYRPDMDLNELDNYKQLEKNDKCEDQQQQNLDKSDQQQQQQLNSQNDDLDIINDDELNTLLDTIDENL